MTLDADTIEGRHVYTVGHSNHPIEHLLALLQRHHIDVVADVRSVPRSAYSPQYDKPTLGHTLGRAGIGYVFLGEQLGGRPPESDFYDEDGRVRYAALAASPRFRAGLERLISGLGRHRVALLCSEEDPRSCHRRLLIGRMLARHGVQLRHLRGDGSIELEDVVELPGTSQTTLFGEPEEQWRSIRSVSRSARPRSSSGSSVTLVSGD